jgi:hypothetical protein
MLPAAYLRVMFPVTFPKSYSPAHCEEWSHVGARRLSAAPPAICVALSTIRSSQRDRPWCPPIGAHVGSLGRGVVHVGSGGPLSGSDQYCGNGLTAARWAAALVVVTGGGDVVVDVVVPCAGSAAVPW